MTNRPRIEYPGAIYHINANALDGMSLFRSEVDRLMYFELFCDQARRSEWCVLIWVLMTTHFHAIVQIEKETLSSGFQRMQSLYARRYNKRHDRRGVVWQKRFHDEVIETDRHLYEAIRYVARNPVRAAMCSEAEDWPWSSYGAAIGAAPKDPLANEEELLKLFAPDTATARRRLKEYVEEADPRRRWRQTRG